MTSPYYRFRFLARGPVMPHGFEAAQHAPPRWGERLTRHWSINGRFLTQSTTGVQRYAREIARALDIALGYDHPWVRDLDVDLLVPPGAQHDLELSRIRTIEVGRTGGHRWEQLTLPFHVRGGLLSLGNVGPIGVPRQIVCMHDVNTRNFPSSYSRAFRLSQRMLLPLLARVVVKVATVSNHSADQLVLHHICRRQKLTIVPNGHEHALRWRAKHSAATLALADRRTIVMIGTPAPHKNIGMILAMADRIAAAGLRIAIVGKTDPRVYRGYDPGLGSDTVVWLGRLSDAELAALLQDALCLAFPSFVEGFGLPPLEAMTLGCAVVVSDQASLPELCGNAALYASPTNPDAWLDCFLQLQCDQNLRQRLIARGRERAKAFSWTRSAQLYLEAMAIADSVVAEADRGMMWSSPSLPRGDTAADLNSIEPSIAEHRTPAGPIDVPKQAAASIGALQ